MGGNRLFLASALLVVLGFVCPTAAFAENLAAPRSLGGVLTPEGSVHPSAGVILPLHRAQLEQELAVLGVDAVYFATVQTGNVELRLTGTITEVADNSFSYSTDQGEVMLIVFRNGVKLRYRIKRLEGDFNQPDGQRFLRKDHLFEFNLQSSAGIDAEVSLMRNNGAYANSVQGHLTDGGVSYLISTNTDGKVTSDIDPPGLNYESRERVTGTISSDRFAVSLDETFRYHVVVFENAIEDIEKTISNRWTLGDDTYELSDGRVFRTFKNGWAAELDSWSASGELMRNQHKVGGLSFEQTPSTVDTVLSVDEQKTIIFSDR